MLAALPGPAGLLLLLVGIFVLGRGPGPAGILFALVLVGLGAASMQARRVRLRRERDELVEAAYTDPLTGLANRRLLLSIVRHEIARHMRHELRFVVVMLDLDGFKALNDRFGHDAGDEMLCDLADSLVGTLRAQDTVARLGGDEFCVIAPETADPRTLVERIQRAVAGAATGYDGLEASVGIALFPEDGASAEKLLRVADEWLVAAKRRQHSDRRPAGRPASRARTAA